MSRNACPLCSEPAVEPRGSEAWTRCRRCGAMVFRRASGPAVLVAHGSEEMSQHIGGVLLAEGMSPLRVGTGNDALRVLARERTGAVVLDVGLEDVPAFQVVERLRVDPQLSSTKIILIASVYDRMAYKRRPTSLYGADDYVEQHHIPDKLPQKLGSLLNVPVPGQAARQTDALRQRIQEADAQIPSTDPRGRARVLARRIVADVALYHQTDVVDALSGRDARPLAEALDEGRRVLTEAVRGEALGEGITPADLIDEAWRELLVAMTGIRR